MSALNAVVEPMLISESRDTETKIARTAFVGDLL